MQFYSGAIEQAGRFSEGFCLRRVHLSRLGRSGPAAPVSHNIATNHCCDSDDCAVQPTDKSLRSLIHDQETLAPLSAERSNISATPNTALMETADQRGRNE